MIILSISRCFLSNITAAISSRDDKKLFKCYRMKMYRDIRSNESMKHRKHTLSYLMFAESTRCIGFDIEEIVINSIRNIKKISL